MTKARNTTGNTAAPAKAAAAPMGKTWVADISSGKIATGAYKPTGNGTAHQRLAAASGISIGPHTIAGSIKPGGVISYRSESVNTRNSVGSCDASGTHLARAAAPLLAKANTNLYTNLPGGGYKYNNSDGSSYTKYASGKSYYRKK